jgi:hypothetical protein
MPKALFDKANTPYVVNMSSKIVSKENNAAFSNSKMTTQIKGTLADLKDLAAAAKDKKDAEKAVEKEERQEKRAEKKEERQERREERRSETI